MTLGKCFSQFLPLACNKGEITKQPTVIGLIVYKPGQAERKSLFSTQLTYCTPRVIVEQNKKKYLSQTFKEDSMVKVLVN